MREGATILLFVRPGSAMEAAFRSAGVEGRLRSAGYKPTLVSSDEQFAAATRSGSWDVVVADLVDAATMPAAASSSPSVLPVMHDAVKTSLEAARRQYRHVVVAPAKGQAVVDAVDAVMADRAAQAKDRKKAGA
jgi:DNA-binding NtrC family response regulator